MSAEGLDSTRKALETVTSVHVYSVQAAPCSQPAADVSTQARTGLSKECVALFSCRIFFSIFGVSDSREGSPDVCPTALTGFLFVVSVLTLRRGETNPLVTEGWYL